MQIVYGPQVAVVKSNLEDFLDTPYSERIDELLDSADSEISDSVPTEKASNAEKPKVILGAHVTGTAVPLESVEDDVFSAKILGDGAAAEPSEGVLYAPCDGVVEAVLDTKHAVNITSDSGCEILLHIGIDTVKLKGKYFNALVSDGQRVKKGDALIEFDIESIKNAGYKVTTPMIICNSDEYSDIRAVSDGRITAGADILTAE